MSVNRVIIRLPKLMGTKRKSPMEQFWSLIRRRIPSKMDNVKMRNGAVFISSESCKILHDNEISWLKPKHRNMPKRQWSWSFGLHWLHVAPFEKEMRNGYAEIIAGRLYEKQKKK